MKIHEKYLETLKTFDDFVTVSEWAVKVSELYPEILENADKQATKHKNDTTGLREIAARLSARLSKGRFSEFVKIDDSERPRKVKYFTEEELEEKSSQNIAEDIEPLRRQDIINNAKNSLEAKELYRISEFENIQKAFKSFFALDFEIDHATALFNDKDQGKHHPSNLQLLLKYHNGKKSKSNWERFSMEEQIDYIKKMIDVQTIVADKLDVDIDEQIVSSLLERLKQVYI